MITKLRYTIVEGGLRAEYTVTSPTEDDIKRLLACPTVRKIEISKKD